MSRSAQPRALRRAFRDALRAHEATRTAFPAPGATLEALDAFEQAQDVWRTEWLRLERASRGRVAGTPRGTSAMD